MLSADSWNDLAEESFLIWLAGRDKGLVGEDTYSIERLQYIGCCGKLTVYFII